VPVALFSLEMSRDQVVERLLAAESFVDLHRLRSGHLRDDDYPKMSRAAGLLGTAPIWIDDTPALTLLELRSKARRLKAEHGKTRKTANKTPWKTRENPAAKLLRKLRTSRCGPACHRQVADLTSAVVPAPRSGIDGVLERERLLKFDGPSILTEYVGPGAPASTEAGVKFPELTP
jgi:hypothetical protein